MHHDDFREQHVSRCGAPVLIIHGPLPGLVRGFLLAARGPCWAANAGKVVTMEEESTVRIALQLQMMVMIEDSFYIRRSPRTLS